MPLAPVIHRTPGSTSPLGRSRRLAESPCWNELADDQQGGVGIASGSLAHARGDQASSSRMGYGMTNLPTHRNMRASQAWRRQGLLPGVDPGSDADPGDGNSRRLARKDPKCLSVAPCAAWDGGIVQEGHSEELAPTRDFPSGSGFASRWGSAALDDHIGCCTLRCETLRPWLRRVTRACSATS